MPRLVLLEDDGRELFSGEVSRANVAKVAVFLRRNMTTLRALAAFKKAADQVEQFKRMMAVGSAPRRRPR